MDLALDTWEMPGTETESWGEGVSVEPDGREGPTVFLRFYEWNVCGAVRPEPFSHADWEQAFLTACHAWGDRAEITYPAHGIDLFLEPRDGRVDLTLRVENRTTRTWPAMAGIVPCLNPGKGRNGEPVTPTLADPDRSNTYFYGSQGFERLTDRDIHVLARRRDDLRSGEIPDAQVSGTPWYEWSDRDATEPLLVRESADENWTTGVAWEDGLWVQGHNPWQCLHVAVRVGPLEPGASMKVRGAIFLTQQGKAAVLERFHDDVER
jgi:hypothetical protein